MNRYVLLIIILISSVRLISQPNYEYPISIIDLQNIRFTEGFWKQRYDTNRDITIPHIFDQLVESNRIDNLLFAANIKEGAYCTHYPFDESDIYKTIEAVSYILMNNDDRQLSDKIDSLISLISKVQNEDGYLYSARNAPSEHIRKSIGDNRWSNLQWSHELYNLGHLYEAAAAHYSATGKSDLLNIATRSADFVHSEFGPNKLQIPPGHQEIELGLIKLFEVTQDEKYLNLAKYFLDIRGKGKELTGRKSWGEYAQDHLPPIEQNEAVGHAVRAAYMYSAMTDISALLGSKDYESAVQSLWSNVINKKLYISGGIGSTGSGEAFGPNYELPNFSAYNETCSSIANMIWNFKMFQLYGDAKYLDVFERTLYNSFLSGVGMEGDRFFYPNPLSSYGSQERAPWFTCACCPPNIARFIASLPTKLYSTLGNELYVNLYASSEAEIQLVNNKISVKQVTNYPWSGNVKLIFNPLNDGEMVTVNLRVPGWLLGIPLDGDLYQFIEEGKMPIISINGEEYEFQLENGFISVDRKWIKGDTIEMELPMDIHRIHANKNVKADRGKVALQRGPLIYCLEWPDNENEFIDSYLLDDAEKLHSEIASELLKGIEVIKGKISNYFVRDNSIQEEIKNFTAIPYYAWAHRGKGEMSVWINRESEYVKPLNSPSLISESTIKVKSGNNIEALSDNNNPSNYKSPSYFVWRANDQPDQWINIEFPDTSEISMVEIFWAVSENPDNLNLPVSWEVLFYWENSWRPVYPTESYSILENEYSRVSFETVKTSELRINIKSEVNSTSGIYEVRIK